MSQLDPVQKPLPTQSYLFECLDYNPSNGLLTWKRRPREHFKTKRAWSVWNARYSSKLAGSVTRFGYISVSLGGHYQAHRLIWKMITGLDPQIDVDHVDLNKSNNRWVNLRAADDRQQVWNRNVRKDNYLGIKGVKRNHKRYMARLVVDGNDKYLGTFDTPEEAASVREAAARELHGEFFR